MNADQTEESVKDKLSLLSDLRSSAFICGYSSAPTARTDHEFRDLNGPWGLARYRVFLDRHSRIGVCHAAALPHRLAPRGRSAGSSDRALAPATRRRLRGAVVEAGRSVRRDLDRRPAGPGT